MNNPQQLFAGMGDLSGLMHDNAKIVDLSWLDVDPSTYDNIPSHNNPNNVIPQLEAAWNMEMISNPTSFIPNQVLSGKSEIQEIGPEHVEPVVMVAKRAMMIGLKGDQILSHLRERFPQEQLKAASSELKKVAAEQGLLGPVYIDLGAFESTREAASFLGTHRARTASLAIGTPLKDANYLGDNGKVRDLGLTHVASVDYSPASLKKFASDLIQSGTIEKDATIDTKEDLQQAVMAGVTATVKERTLEAVPFKGVSDKQARALLASAQGAMKVEAEKKAASERYTEARPILASMQDEMAKGKMGPALREVITAKFAEETVKNFAPEISRLASLQGLMGKLYMDVGLYASTDEAIRAVRSASKPTYIIASSDAGDDRANRVASVTGCKIMPRTGPTMKEASSLVHELQMAGKIPNKAASALTARLANMESASNVIRDANIAAMTHIPEVRTGGVAGNMLSAEKVEPKGADTLALKTAAMAALSRGFSIQKVQDKLASLTCAGEAYSLVRNALNSLDTVPSAILDRCATERYNLGVGAKIASSGKCASCVRSIGGYCQKQAAKLVSDKTAKTTVPQMDPSELYGLRTASMKIQVSPSVSFDPNSFIKPAQDSFGTSSSLDSFFA